MSGTVKTLFCQRLFDFGDVGANGSETVVVERAVDVREYGDAVLQVKVHSLTVGTGAKIEVSVTTISPASEDPEQDFLAASAAATATVDASSTAGTLVVVGVGSDFGAFLQVAVTGTQPGATTNVRAQLSAELVLRSGIPPKPQTQGDFTLDSASPTLTVGDGSGSPSVLLDKSAAGVGTLDFQTAGAAAWKVELDASDDLVFARGSGPTTSAKALGATGNWEFSNDVDLTDSGAQLKVGDGTGGPDLVLDKGGAWGSDIQFHDGGTLRWAIQHDSAENLEVKRYDASGTYQDDVIRLDDTDGTVLARKLVYTFHAYDRGDNSKCYVPLNTVSESTTLSSATNSAHVIAPHDGRLYAVWVRFSSNGGSTKVTFHKNDDTSDASNRQVTQSVGANTSVEFDFSNEAAATFSAGDLLSVSIKPTNTPNDVNVTCVWRFDET